MKALLGRELRRQGFYALGPLVILLASPLLGRALANPNAPPGHGLVGFLAPELWLLLLAGVLGVAAVAPDRGSGGQAFLRRIPLSLRRAFALRVAASVTWLGLGLGLAIAAVALQEGPLSLNPGLVLGWPLAYAAGLVASSVTQRPLAAIGLAIPIGILATLAYLGPLLATGLRPTGGEAMAGLLLIPTGVTVGAAFLAYRYGRIHLEGLRPFAIALGSLLAFSLLGSGGTALARSAHKGLVLESLRPFVMSGRNDVSLVTLTGVHWYGWEQRVLVLRPDQAPLALPREGARSPQLSPDGRQVLVRGDTITTPGALCDLETGRVTELDLGFSEARDILWREEGPALVSLATSLSLRIEAAIEPGQRRRVLIVPCDDVRTLSSDDLGRVYVIGTQRGLQRITGLGALPLPSVEPGRKVFPTPREELDLEIEELPFPKEQRSKVRGLRISPGGELGLVLLNGGRVALLEVATGRLRELPRSPTPEVLERHEAPGPPVGEGRIRARDLGAFVDPRRVMGTYRLAFGPQGRGVVVEGASGWTVWCDLQRGSTQTSFEPKTGSGLPAWSSEGEAVLLSSGRIWEAGQAAPRTIAPKGGSPLGWLGSQRLVISNASEGRDPDLRGLTIFDLATGHTSQVLGGAQ